MLIAVIPTEQDLKDIKSHYKSIKKSKKLHANHLESKTFIERNQMVLSNCSTNDCSYNMKNNCTNDSSSSENFNKSNLEIDLEKNFYTILENIKKYDNFASPNLMESNLFLKNKDKQNKYNPNYTCFNYTGRECSYTTDCSINNNKGKFYDLNTCMYNNSEREINSKSKLNEITADENIKNFKKRTLNKSSIEISKVSLNSNLFSRKLYLEDNNFKINNELIFSLKNNFLNTDKFKINRKSKTQTIIENKKVIFDTNDYIKMVDDNKINNLSNNQKKLCYENNTLSSNSSEKKSNENKNNNIRKYLINHNQVKNIISDSLYSSSFSDTTDNLSDSFCSIEKQLKNKESVNLNKFDNKSSDSEEENEYKIQYECSNYTNSILLPSNHNSNLNEDKKNNYFFTNKNYSETSTDSEADAGDKESNFTKINSKNEFYKVKSDLLPTDKLYKTSSCNEFEENFS
jgi:hypothetical protein